VKKFEGVEIMPILKEAWGLTALVPKHNLLEV